MINIQPDRIYPVYYKLEGWRDNPRYRIMPDGTVESYVYTGKGEWQWRKSAVFNDELALIEAGATLK